MKRILYLLPFILYLLFFASIIFMGGTIKSFVLPDFFLLLGLLLICGLGALSSKKIFNVIGMIALFIVTFALIKIGIENDYFVLAETKIAISLLIYYFIAFYISKDKLLIYMTGAIIAILLFLFVPIKIQHRDGGTVEYRAISYRFFKWNKMTEDGNYYNAQQLHWFPDNFHSKEYYEPIQSPLIYVATNTEKILSSKGGFQWSKTVDGQQIFLIADVFDSAVLWNYNNKLIVTDENTINIETTYDINNVKYTEYKEEYANTENRLVRPEFKNIDFNNEIKSIDLTNFENGEYIISFSIKNNEDYADYAFKVQINK